MDDKERSRDSSSRDRDRSRRGDRPSRFSDSNKERDRSGDRGRKSSNNRVYVSNISYEYRWQDLKDLFRNLVGEVSFVELFVDEHEKPKGCGIVEFSDSASVKKCMEVMHRYDLKGRKLVIKEDFGTERDKYGNIINARRNREHREHRGGGGDMKGDWDSSMRDRDRRERRGNWESHPPSLLSNMINRNSISDSGEMKWGNTYGLSPNFLESLGINRPLVNRVFIANLDYKVDVKKLREVFKLAGKIIDVELYQDKDGNSRGFAVVDYDHPVESVQAISMFHNQLLYDRPMTVRMDRVEHSEMPMRLPEGLKGIGMGLGVNGEPLREVSRNLPSSGNPSSGNIGSGAGILGAVPNQGLSLGNAAAALSNVVNAPALAGLAGSSAVSALQGLTGVQTQFLANNLSELGLAGLTSTASLVRDTLNQNQTLTALANSNLGNSGMGNNMGNSNMGLSSMSGNMGGSSMSSNSMGGNGMGNNMGGNNMSSSSNMGGGNMSSSNMGNMSSSNMGSSNMGTSNMGSSNMGSSNMGSSNMGSNSLNQMMSSRDGGNLYTTSTLGGSQNLMKRDYTSTNRDYETTSSIRSNSYELKSDSDYRDDYRQQTSTALYSTVNNGSQRTAPALGNKSGDYSDTVLVSNLPTSASWKMLREKFLPCGDIQFVEMKSKDTAMIRFSADWEAERAIQHFDRTRLDGRTIDVRFF